MARRIRQHDWTATLLGSIENWPPSLKTVTDLVLAHDVPMAVLWGEGSVILCNDAAHAVLSVRHLTALGQPLNEVWPEGRDIYEPLIERVRASETVKFKDTHFPAAHHEAPEGSWHDVTLSPLRDEKSAVAGVLVTVFDTTEGHRAERALREHERVLLFELQHRVRNTVAVIRSLVRRSAETSESLEDYAAHLEGRINAFARVQSVITRDPTRGVDLGTIVADELLGVGAREGWEATIGGSSLLMKPKAAELMGLALHELATNAMKYGALTRPDGKIRVDWEIKEGTWLQFTWQESGMQDLAASPERRGFGAELLERTLTYELEAEATLSFEPHGLVYVATIPLDELVADSAAPIVH